MNFSIEHIAVPATNPAALKDWYVRVLGARPVWDNGQNPPTCLIALSAASGWRFTQRKSRCPSAATTSWPASGTWRCAWIRWTAAKANWKSAA